MMSIGNKTKISDLGAIPKNFIVKKLVTTNETTCICEVVIMHGGNAVHMKGLVTGFHSL